MWVTLRVSIAAMHLKRLTIGLNVCMLASVSCSKTEPNDEATDFRVLDLVPSAQRSSKLKLTSGQCGGEDRHQTRAPGIADRHLRLDTWLAKLPAGEAKRTLLSPQQIDRHNAHRLNVEGTHRDISSPTVFSATSIRNEIDDRKTWFEKKLQTGEFVEGSPGSFLGAQTIMMGAHPRKRHEDFRIVHREVPLYCVPLDHGIYRPSRDPEFDRNRCSSLHQGEAVRLLLSEAPSRSGRRPKPWTYLRTGHSVGWVRGLSAFTPSLSHEQILRFSHRQPRLMVLKDLVHLPSIGDVRSSRSKLRMGVDFPLVAARHSGRAPHQIVIPSATGLEITEIPEGLSYGTERLPLTRQILWATAFAALNQPYGWGGHGGGRDCSRFIYDLFMTVGVFLARHSATQAKLGSPSIDVSDLPTEEKRTVIRQAAAQGIVLLYMPGHIMMYLGSERSKGNEQDFVISSLSEFHIPCANGYDRVQRLDRVTVTNLELGRGSKKKSFLERITTVAVFGAPTDSD